MITFTKELLSEVMCKHAEKENGLHDLLEIMFLRIAFILFPDIWRGIHDIRNKYLYYRHYRQVSTLFQPRTLHF